ncbi:MAG: BamA/TamA family outer membrane protein, partial [Myxococcales bacterium]|nr:BamA/TamA family outer membrane protein [Myxococcales bacterium]
RDKVIRRELIIEEGKLYSNTAIQLSQRRVTSLGFFEKVEITPKRGERDDIINMTVKVTERPTGTFQAGAGLSSTERFLANIQVSQNNLFGRGQLLTLQFQRSSLRTQLNARFYDRYFLDTPVRFSASGYNFDFLFRDYEQTSTGGSLTFGYPLLNPINTASDLSLSLTYKLENVAIRPGGQNNRDSRQVGALFRGGLTSSVQGALTYDSRNDRFFTTRGQYHMARVEFADDAWTLSQSEFMKLDLESRLYMPLFWQFILRLNGQLGYVTSVDPNKPIPLQERYLVGGPLTTRGFQRFSLGPSRRVALTSSDPSTRVTDFKIGGNKQLLLTAEVEFPIFTAINLRGVVFADAGNAFGEGQGFTLVPDLLRTDENGYNDALRTAVGLGFRWFSPIGLLRFEWGFPLQRLRTEDPMVFEFSIGNAF